MGKKTVAVFGAFDTKGKEFEALIRRLEAHGLSVLTIDFGIMGCSPFVPGISAADIACAAGMTVASLRAETRQSAQERLGAAVAQTVNELRHQGKIDGVCSMGGGQGSFIGAMVLRSLPVGFPKVFISTIANTGEGARIFEGCTDTLFINSILDIAGQNSILEMVISRGAAALAGIVNSKETPEAVDTKSKKRVGMTMLGITTPFVSGVQSILEQNGCEVMTFHAIGCIAKGMGGSLMESLAADGLIDAIIDATPVEVSFPLALASEMPLHCEDRISKAGEAGVPRILIPGGLDIVNMPDGAIPERFAGRMIKTHTGGMRIMRTSPEENIVFGKELARRINGSKGRRTVVFPLRGLSSNDIEGQEFYDLEADRALLYSLKSSLSNDTKLAEIDAHINDKAFIQAVSDIYLNSTSI